ncbi:MULTISPECIES: hypothetical protein [Acinetobacter]|uniref:hypothetical protein n=1 Tax=Acinetobacter TaxID=469 RepID=UPI0028138165|nr:hypothetical protein [Acinetobacter sp. 12966]MDQ9947793.1 hypothetical protein [Acinetobacter sp. 12966]
MNVLSSTTDGRTFALIELSIRVDLKAAKNVDALKSDQKILVKNLGTSTTKNAIIAAAKKSDIKSFELSVNGKVFKPDSSVSSGAAVYKGASNEDIYTAFKEIAGIRTLPNSTSPMYQPIKGRTSLNGQPGYIIRVPQEDGSTILLRNFSFS